MSIETGLVITVVGWLASIVGMWIKHSVEFAKLESKVDANKVAIDNIITERKDFTNELRQIKDLLVEVKIEIAKIKVKQELNETP